MDRTKISYRIHHPKALKTIAGEVDSTCGMDEAIFLRLSKQHLQS